MKAVSLGLCLSLLGGVAMAQTALSDTLTPPTNGPRTVLPPQGGPDGNPPPQSPNQAAQGNAQPGAPMGQGGQMHRPGPSGEGYPGEVIETPYGTYVLTDRPDVPQGMDESRDHPEGAGPGDPEDDRGPNPHPHGPMRPRDSKAAHIRMKGPDGGIDIKCPDDEPVKGCADAVMPLLDKVMSGHH